jgi:hypothetical protein
MSKPVLPTPTNVIPITEEKRRVIAADETTKRFILAIGKQRLAFDFLTRVTELPAHTGDQPVPILPIKKRQGPSAVPFQAP